MKDTVSPEEYYRERMVGIENVLRGLQKRKRYLGLLRLAIAVAGVLITWLLWQSVLPAIIFFLLFLLAVRVDLQNRDAIRHQERLLHICRQELRYLEHDFADQPDGSAFIDDHHPYTGDLDIFGKASLFQFLSRASSEQGKAKLAGWLSAPAATETILLRQAAVGELCGMTSWRHDLQAHGAGSAIRFSTQAITRTWLSETSRFAGKKFWVVVRFLVPSLALTWLAIYILEKIELPAFLFGLTIFMIVAFWISRLVYPVYVHLNRIGPALETLAATIGCIEDAAFKDPLLQSLQQRCYHDSVKASLRIRRLRGILDRFDYRMNPLVYVPLNIFFLWDLQQVLQLEQWRADNRQDTDEWFESMAELEALNSLATLAFNHPHWCFPTVKEDKPEFSARQLGHPLINPSKMIGNDFSTIGKGQITLVTGSNMAGKSTFLRSVGVNMVLAGMGAAVCAEAMTLSPRRVMSSMRIKDNLEESTSTFYAELKKLKAIIDAVNTHEPVFILLDEILRGTNSYDRQTGALALVKQLIRQQASGIIATHDLELAALEKEYPGSLHNYHFDVKVSGTEMYFDYILKPGVCQSMNASLLMQKIGIDIR